MPTMQSFQPQSPINAIVFDCDGTLSGIEGIDELAELNHVGPTVEALTQAAMGQTGLTPDIYRQRLDLVKPTQQQVTDLGHLYLAHLAPDARGVIQALQHLNKPIFLISAGINLAVKMLGAALNIPNENIFAVQVTFHADGSYANFDATSPLTFTNGKCELDQHIKNQYGTIAHIGDGMNDFVVKNIVTRFIGYGGVYYRKNIEMDSEFYIKSKSMAPVLPLLLTPQEVARLNPGDQVIYQHGREEIALGNVTINLV